jgi:LuxR family transcriptional regulator, maltose regulon positive regulatory protein
MRPTACNQSAELHKRMSPAYKHARGLLLYAALMSSADEAIASSTHVSCEYRPDSSSLAYLPARAHSALDTWGIRREIVRARNALMRMQLREASKSTGLVKRLLSNRGKSYSSRYARALRMLEASILVAQDDLSGARSVLVSMDLQANDTLAATILRYIDWKHGERETPCAPDTADYLAPPVGGRALCRILSLCVSAAVAFDRLQLSVSANLATEALQLARIRYGNNSTMSTLPAALLAQVAYEQGRRDEAEALLRPRISVIRTSGLLECVARASVLLARLSLHRGRARAALALLRETEALGRARCWPRLISIASTEYTRTLEALRYDHEQRAGTRTPIRTRFVFPALDSRRPRQLPPRAGTGNTSFAETVTFSTVESALRRASAAASLDPVEDSYELLVICLRIGAARGLCMAFVDAGGPLLTLLERLYYALPTNDPELADLRPYIATLLRFTLQPTCDDSSSISYRSLSRRETGILQMIALGMSNKRIAQSLGITPETVKSHAKSIFVKLASHTRAQAVARAEAVGFL